MNASEFGITLVGGLGTLLLLAIAVLFGTVILRAAAKWAEKLDLPFWPSAKTVLLYTLGGSALGAVVALLAGLAGDGAKHRLIEGLMAPAAFLLQSAVISSRHQLSFGKGIKISIFMWLVCFLVGVAVAIVTIGIMSVMPAFR